MAVRRFGERADVDEFYASAARYRVSPSKSWITHLHLLGLVLYHRGHTHQRPRKYMPTYAIRPPLRPAMEAVVDRWLALRRLTDRPITVHHLGLALRYFLDWLAIAEPDITNFAQVTRDHVLGFLGAMASSPTRAPADRWRRLRAGRGRPPWVCSFAKPPRWAGTMCPDGHCSTAAITLVRYNGCHASSRPTNLRG